MENFIVLNDDESNPTSTFRRLRHIAPADDIADGFDDASVREFMRAASECEDRADD